MAWSWPVPLKARRTSARNLQPLSADACKVLVLGMCPVIPFEYFLERIRKAQAVFADHAAGILCAVLEGEALGALCVVSLSTRIACNAPEYSNLFEPQHLKFQHMLYLESRG